MKRSLLPNSMDEAKMPTNPDPSKVFDTLPSISLKRGQNAYCPECKADQGDPIEDFFALGKSSVQDRCGGCGVNLRFLSHSDTEFEVKALKSKASLIRKSAW